MYVNQLTNETYIDRKEAKISLGTSNFNRLLKKKIIYFINGQPMGYRIIPASLVIGLTTNEAYTYFCLLAKSDYNTYISHVKLETLSQLTGISKTEYISKHIEKLIKKGLLRKDTQQNIGNKGVFNTCTYYLYKPQIDWIRIDLDLLEENIPNKLKAFLILLKCICLNNTNYTGYNKSEICKKLNISRPTLDSYLNQCIDKKLIKEEQNGYTLTNTHLFKIDIVKGKDDDEVYTKVYIPMADFFASQSITIPPYNKKIVGKIIDHYSALPFLAAALKKRKIPEGTVCTWKYLAKVLKVNIVEKPRPIPPKVTLIM